MCWIRSARVQRGTLQQTPMRTWSTSAVKTHFLAAIFPHQAISHRPSQSEYTSMQTSIQVAAFNCQIRSSWAFSSLVSSSWAITTWQTQIWLTIWRSTRTTSTQERQWSTQNHRTGRKTNWMQHHMAYWALRTSSKAAYALQGREQSKSKKKGPGPGFDLSSWGDTKISHSQPIENGRILRLKQNQMLVQIEWRHSPRSCFSNQDGERFRKLRNQMQTTGLLAHSRRILAVESSSRNHNLRLCLNLHSHQVTLHQQRDNRVCRDLPHR